MRHHVAAAAIGGAIVLLASGCTAIVDTSTPTVLASPAATPTPSTSRSPVIAQPSPPQPEPSPVNDACAGLEPQYAINNDGTNERLSGYSIIELRDTGPVDFASGRTTFNDAGQPAAYEVAAGDTYWAIADRFCVYPHWLTLLNQVRRNGENLYVGDTLNLDAYTITSVGSENGVVYNNPPSSHIPPQR